MTEKPTPKEVQPPQMDQACGATHNDCPNTWKGTCERPAGHEGSHLCSSCKSMF